MKTSIIKKVYLSIGLMMVVLACPVLSDDIPYIFDYATFIDTSVPGVSPMPHLDYPHDWQSLFDTQYSNNQYIGFVLKQVDTAPYDGTNPEALADAMSYINTNGYYLSFVFSDYELTYKNENCLETVDQVRNHANPLINSARIGSYRFYPGTPDYSNLWGNYDRSEEDTFYNNSGLDVAMPELYPRTAYRNHAVRDDIFGANLCVSIPHALFWTLLERFSITKNHMPSGHLLIPWLGALVVNDGYEAPMPSKAECRAILKHIRLRGADGYYTWSNGDNTNYSDRFDYRDDMYSNGWKPLDRFFEYPGKNEILNLTTNKTGGVEWSGMRRGNYCSFIISNYTANPVQVDLPDTIENLPDLSPSVAASEHLWFNYVIGPRSCWKLDENTGVDVSDEMEAENDGTISGATWTDGKIGSALSFDGSNDGVSFGDVLDVGTGDRSISLWFKTTTNDSTQRVLLSKGNSSTSNQHAILLCNGKIRCLMDVSGTDRIIDTGVTVNDGNWHHIAVTINRKDKMKLYLDGTLNDEVDISADANIDAQNIYGFYLGRSNTGQYFPGSIDEVKVFNSILCVQEVFDEYAEVSLNTMLDEQQGTTIHDDSGIANSGTVSGATWTDGKIGSALTFDGSNDSVNFGDVMDIGTGDRSISLWFKTTTNDSTQRVLLSKGNSSTSNQHAILLRNGEIRCLMDVSGTDRIVDTNVMVNDGNWHHIAVTIKRSDKMKLYLDGTLNDEVDISTDVNVDAQNTYGFYLGCSNTGQYFPGSIDEVKIYHKSLSASEVVLLYNLYQ